MKILQLVGVFILLTAILCDARKVKRQADAAASNCGKRKLSTQGLIVSGFSTIAGDWPWHTAIYHLNRAQRNYACGGTLVNEYQVITAAHCVVDANTGSALFPEIIIVQLGAYDITVTSTNSVEQKAHKINVHDQYVHNLHRNDVAIITLTSKVKFTTYVQPACIWQDDVEKIAKTGKALGVAVGWGITETDETSSKLKAATMPIIGFFDCLDSNREVFGKTLTQDNFCAGRRNGTTVCNGDSGGGLFVKYRNTWFLAGIVSFSSLRDFGQPYCSTNDYGVFVNVPKFSTWFEKYLLTSGNRFEPGQASIGPRKSVQKCREYESKGIAATRKQRSYVYKVQLQKNNKYITDGHFISETFVITSAAAIYAERPTQVLKSRGKVQNTYEIVQSILHPEFVNGLLDYDIALIKMKENAGFGASVKLTCLYTSPTIDEALILSDFTEPKMRIYSNTVCEAKLKTLRQFLITDINSEICTSNCLSRELIVKVANAETTYLAGLPSYCEDNGDGEGVYTRLYTSLDWIESVVWG